MATTAPAANTKAAEIVEYRGVENLVAAEVTEDTKENYTTGDVFPIAGVAEISKKSNSDSATHFYDNSPAVIIGASGSDEIEVKTSVIPLDVLAKLTGQIYDDATGSLIEGDQENKYFALGYKTQKTNGDEVCVWRLKGQFAIPDEASKTIDDGTDAEGQTLKYTGIKTIHKFTKNSKGARAVVTDGGAGKADLTKFFDKVTTPDTLPAAKAK